MQYLPNAFSALIFSLSCCAVSVGGDEDLESSRIYGKMFVSPIEVGKFPPVCVTEYVCGPKAKTTFASMRDPKRPSIIVFCKQLRQESKVLLVALDASTTFTGIPLFITVTAEKGIADGSPENYLSETEAGQMGAEISQGISEMCLTNATVGIAKNRFWRSSLGYGDGDDLVIGYVRGKVLYLKSLNSYQATQESVSKLVAELVGFNEILLPSN